MFGREIGRVKVAALLASVCLTAAAAQALPASKSNLPRLPSADAGPIVVFFEPGNSDLPQSAQPLANRALAEAVEKEEWRVRIDPFVGSTAGEEMAAIAAQRAQNLATFLTANGIPEWRVDTRPPQEARTVDPIIGIDAQRVEISFHLDNSATVARR